MCCNTPYTVVTSQSVPCDLQGKVRQEKSEVLAVLYVPNCRGGFEPFLQLRQKQSAPERTQRSASRPVGAPKVWDWSGL